ncbi:MAG TPA: hypothetical protein PLK76_00620 [bacterium]|nr:hypothetical protein [bacterium]
MFNHIISLFIANFLAIYSFRFFLTAKVLLIDKKILSSDYHHPIWVNVINFLEATIFVVFSLFNKDIIFLNYLLVAVFLSLIYALLLKIEYIKIIKANYRYNWQRLGYLIHYKIIFLNQTAQKVHKIIKMIIIFLIVLPIIYKIMNIFF